MPKRSAYASAAKKKATEIAIAAIHEPVIALALDEPERGAARDCAHHAAEPAEHADGEGRTEIGVGLQRRDREHQAEHGAGRAGERGAERERGDERALDPDSHQRRGVAVHPHRDDGATEPRAAQQEIERGGHGERDGRGHRAVERQVEPRELRRAPGGGRPDRAVVGAEAEQQRVSRQELEAERDDERHEHWRADHPVEDAGLQSGAEQANQQRDRRQRDERMPAEEMERHPRQVAAEDDQRAVQQIDDVEDAPDQRKACCYAGVEPAQQQAVEQYLA